MGTAMASLAAQQMAAASAHLEDRRVPADAAPHCLNVGRAAAVAQQCGTCAASERRCGTTRVQVLLQSRSSAKGAVVRRAQQRGVAGQPPIARLGACTSRNQTALILRSQWFDSTQPRACRSSPVASSCRCSSRDMPVPQTSKRRAPWLFKRDSGALRPWMCSAARTAVSGSMRGEPMARLQRRRFSRYKNGGTWGAARGTTSSAGSPLRAHSGATCTEGVAARSVW